jgi:hypothetical protein
MDDVSPLVVRNPAGTSHLALVNSFLTWQMYNSFGGRSGYLGPGTNVNDIRSERSRVVSFDRPYAGSGEYSIKRDAISMNQFLEKNNILVDQYSDIDLYTYPSITRHYNGIVFSGHAEYMPRQLFNTLIAARNNGVNIAFFGANNAYWQTRLDPSPTGPDRRVVMYRVSTQDPNTIWDQVTLEYDDKRINTPSNLITGELTSGVHVYGTLHATSVPHWISIPSNATVSTLSSDSEIEGYFAQPSAPKNVHKLFVGNLNYLQKPVQNAPKVPVEESIWFTTPSGAAIFNGGFTTWSCDLAESCVYPTITQSSQRILQTVTIDVLKYWAQKNIGPELEKGEAGTLTSKTNPLLIKPIHHGHSGKKIVDTSTVASSVEN